MNFMNLQDVPEVDITLQMCLEAVTSNGSALAVVKQNGMALEYVPNETIEICSPYK